MRRVTPYGFFFGCMAIDWLGQTYGLPSELRLLLTALWDDVCADSPLSKRLRKDCLDRLYTVVCRGPVSEEALPLFGAAFADMLTPGEEDMVEFKVVVASDWRRFVNPVVELTLRLLWHGAQRPTRFDSLRDLWQDKRDNTLMTIFVSPHYLIFFCGDRFDRTYRLKRVRHWIYHHYTDRSMIDATLLRSVVVPVVTYDAPCSICTMQRFNTHSFHTCPTHGAGKRCCCYRLGPRPPITLIVWV